MTYRVTLLPVSFFLNLIIFTAAIGGTVSYQYDALDRLVRMEQLDGTVIVYDYDNPGNRIVKTVTVVDSDGDGIADTIENNICTDVNDADTDDDGIPDGDESKKGQSKIKMDSAKLF